MAHIRKRQEAPVRRILITGGCGFIGTNLVKYLAGRGFQIRILDNFSVGKEANIRRLQPQAPKLKSVEITRGDIREWDVVSQAVDGAEAVVHLAAISGIESSLKNPIETYDVNVGGTINLLEACRKSGVGRFILASSNAAVGEQPPPIDEERAPAPLSPYGAAKLAGEALCSAYHHSFGLTAVALRFANCYGPYSDHKTSVIANFIRWVIAEKPLIIYGDGQQTRDFIHVDDICQAIHRSLTAGVSGGSLVFQIGSGVETSINELIQVLREITGRELAVSYQPGRPGDINRICLNITKAARMLGFKPEIELREGVKRLWEWQCQQTKGVTA